jgi:hypothetical protein
MIAVARATTGALDLMALSRSLVPMAIWYPGA